MRVLERSLRGRCQLSKTGTAIAGVDSELRPFGVSGDESGDNAHRGSSAAGESYPELYGGTERVVSWLTEELVGLGCDVTLFASGNSCTSATLVPACPRALRLSRPMPDPWSAYAGLLDAVADRAKSFDVIHCHTTGFTCHCCFEVRLPSSRQCTVASICRIFPSWPAVSSMPRLFRFRIRSAGPV